MGHHHHPAEVDPRAAEHAQYVWTGFTRLLKYGVIVSVLTLALLGLAFVDW